MLVRLFKSFCDFGWLTHHQAFVEKKFRWFLNFLVFREKQKLKTNVYMLLLVCRNEILNDLGYTLYNSKTKNLFKYLLIFCTWIFYIFFNQAKFVFSIFFPFC